MLHRRFVLITLFLSLWTLNLNPITAAEPVDYGDVLNVNYSLWLDEAHTIEKAGNIDVDLEYVYLRRTQDEKIPNTVVNQFPESAEESLKQIYVQPFINAMIGMRVNQEKDFMIKAEDHGLSDEDFYYHIKILAILYDASEHTTIVTSTTTESSTPYEGLTELLIIGGGAVLLGGGFILWRFQVSRTYKSALSSEESKSVKEAKSFQKEKDRLKELRELTESVAGVEETTKKTEVKFRPRRR
ncbi:MAG: hypothetical protein ACFFB5_01025 [Promethearchaeota archaeon]